MMTLYIFHIIFNIFHFPFSILHLIFYDFILYFAVYTLYLCKSFSIQMNELKFVYKNFRIKICVCKRLQKSFGIFRQAENQISRTP